MNAFSYFDLEIFRFIINNIICPVKFAKIFYVNFYIMFDFYIIIYNVIKIYVCVLYTNFIHGINATNNRYICICHRLFINLA